ncbi:hypothetical protein PINS_up010322 [Pythium insidiosum]|nr:hypothetical protein PINS_up010322 [Pythium insidiosum]
MPSMKHGPQPPVLQHVDSHALRRARLPHVHDLPALALAAPQSQSAFSPRRPVEATAPPLPSPSSLSAAQWLQLSRQWVATCLVVLLQLLRNVTLSLLCAALALWCCACGNVLSRKPVREQRFVEFLSASVFWCGALFSTIIVSIQSSLLMTKRFLACPDRAIGFYAALWRVLRATLHLVVALLTVLVATVVLLDELTAGRARRVHLEYYACSLAGVTFISAVWLRTRRIYFDETVQGFERRQLQQHARRLAPADLSPPHQQQHQRTRGRRQRACSVTAWRPFVRILVRAAPSAVSMAFAGLYVQATSQRRLETQQDLFAFGAASLLVKLVVQECIKLLMLRRHENDIRTMFLAVGLPTVLIDTQIRVMMQLVQRASFSTDAAVAMALIEVAMRSAKIAMLRLQLARREQLVRRKINDLRVVAARVQVSARHRKRSHAARGVDALNELQQWRQRRLRFHAAEVYADMAAEYIAIGCSTMILVLYGDHPRFQLWHLANAAMTESGGDEARIAPPSLRHHVSMVAVQCAVELAVDVVASLLEVAQGVDFHELRRHSAYIAVTFIGIGVMNVHVTTVMFMRTTD